MSTGGRDRPRSALLKALVQAALDRRPRTLGELCAWLAHAGLVGERYMPQQEPLPLADVTVDTDSAGRHARVLAAGRVCVVLWEEYPEVRAFRERALARHRWP